MIQKKKLGEIANISAGQGAPQGAENYSEEGTPFVKAGDLFYLVNGERECDIQKVSEEVAKNHRLKLYPKGTVLFAKSGMSCMKGYVYATNAECYVVSHLACIMPFDVDSKYLKYYFEYHKPNQLVKDASYPSISLADIAEMPINVFDDQTEAKIVDNLDAVNSLIAKSKEELGMLDNIVKSRFVEMFGEPATNPMGWMETTVGRECYSIKDGPHVSLPDIGRENGGHPFISVRNIVNHVIDFSTARYISDEDFASARKKCCPQKGDMLYSKGGTTGIAKLIDVDVEFANWVHLAVLKYDKGKLNGVFFENMLNCDYCYRQSQKLTKGIANRDLVLSAMAQIKMYRPPLELQNRFAAFVAEVDKSKLAVKQSLEKLETLKKSLMQQYFG